MYVWGPCTPEPSEVFQGFPHQNVMWKTGSCMCCGQLWMFLKVVSKRPESGPWVSKHYYVEVVTPCFHFYGVHFTGRWIPRAVNQKSSCFLACSVFRQPRWWWCYPRLTEAVICVSEQQHEVKCWMDLMRAALCGFWKSALVISPSKTVMFVESCDFHTEKSLLCDELCLWN